MKKILLLFFIFSLLHQFSYSQTPGEWVWMHGSSTSNNTGNFGTQGVPSPTNEPPALYEPCEWTDLNGNFWFFGGLDVNWGSGAHNDLWKYNPVTKEWTWMSGTHTLNDAGVFGTQGVTSATNRPPGRSWGPASWVDSTDNLWMFGGQLISGLYNDLWKYDISTNMWTWMKGANFTGSAGLYGIQGVPNIANNPKSRGENAAAWTDNAGDLWLYGGSGNCNDLWRFNIASDMWTWMKGDSVANYYPTYGIKGVEAAANNPLSNWVYSRWKDKNGNFWLFTNNNYSTNCIMWRFNPISNNWAWMSGDTVNAGMLHGTQCVESPANSPGIRFENRAAWTDVNGNLWMFGGDSYNDLWLYRLTTNQWTWISGDSINGATGSWGTLGVSSPSNKPNGRMGSVAWTDSSCHLYLFGGCNNGYTNFNNDLWMYTIDSACGGGTCSQSLPQATFVSSDTVFCNEAGKCISFTDHSTGNPTSWHWLFPGATPDSSLLQNPDSICYYTPGTYPVTLIVTNSSGTDTITVSPMITLANPPVAPTLTLSNDTIFSSSAAGYQWYYNGIPIAGATDSFYVYSSTGTYSVLISDGNGCSVLSSGMIITGLSHPSFKEGFGVSPNPATDEFTVYGLQFTGRATLEVYNVVGEKVYSRQLQTSNLKLQTINCKQLPAGVYFIRVTDGQREWIGKIIIEK